MTRRVPGSTHRRRWRSRKESPRPTQQRQFRHSTRPVCARDSMGCGSRRATGSPCSRTPRTPAPPSCRSGSHPQTRKRSTWMSSRVAGAASAYQREPRVVGMPRQSSRSFTPNGTPASGPSRSPAARVRSTASAAASAPSASTNTNALSAGCCSSIWCSACSTSCRAVILPVRTAVAVRWTSPSFIAGWYRVGALRLRCNCGDPVLRNCHANGWEA